MPFFFKHDGVAYSVLHHKHTIYIAGGNLMMSTWVLLRIINKKMVPGVIIGHHARLIGEKNLQSSHL